MALLTRRRLPKQPGLKKFYIDAFSGAGIHLSKRTGEQVEGSPARALKISPPFDRFYFIDLDADRAQYLRGLCSGRSDVHIHTGDSSQYLRQTLLPTIKYEKFNRALCLLDPYGLHLDWEGIGSWAIAGHRHVSQFPSNGHEQKCYLEECRQGAAGWHSSNEQVLGR